jgi:Primase C terminal 1 (PriCT-1)
MCDRLPQGRGQVRYASAAAPPWLHGQHWTLRVLQGSLADLGRLPVARSINVDRARARKETTDSIRKGERNNALFRYALEQARHVDDLDTFIDVVRTRNMDCEPPLADTEVISIAASAWRYQEEGRNLVGRGQAMVIDHGTFDRLTSKSPDPWLLYQRARMIEHQPSSDTKSAVAIEDAVPIAEKIRLLGN